MADDRQLGPDVVVPARQVEPYPVSRQLVAIFGGMLGIAFSGAAIAIIFALPAISAAGVAREAASQLRDSQLATLYDQIHSNAALIESNTMKVAGLQALEAAHTLNDRVSTCLLIHTLTTSTNPVLATARVELTAYGKHLNCH